MKFTIAAVVTILTALLAADTASAKVVTSCNKDGDVGLIINNATKSGLKSLLDTLSINKVGALFVFGDDVKDIGGAQIIPEIKKHKHLIGYSFKAPKNNNLHNHKAILKQFNRIKKHFKTNYSINLKYVNVPYDLVNTDLGKIVDQAAKEAGLVAISHSIYLGTNEAETAKALGQHILNPDGESHIALLVNSPSHVAKSISTLITELKHADFNLVPFNKCAVTGHGKHEDNTDGEALHCTQGVKEGKKNKEGSSPSNPKKGTKEHKKNPKTKVFINKADAEFKVDKHGNIVADANANATKDKKHTPSTKKTTAHALKTKKDLADSKTKPTGVRLPAKVAPNEFLHQGKPVVEVGVGQKAAVKLADKKSDSKDDGNDKSKHQHKDGDNSNDSKQDQAAQGQNKKNSANAMVASYGIIVALIVSTLLF